MKKLIYCIVMSRIWEFAHKLYNWAEDRRPAGGFKPGNLYWK